MADHKKWFKVWSSILTDIGFSNLRLEDVGRWTRLGALMCQQGDHGKLKISPPAEMFLLWFRVPDLPALKEALKVLPNVVIEERSQAVQEHGQNGQFERSMRRDETDNDSFIVIIKNWHKYQVDSTIYDRVKRLRCKRRGEEKRKEEKRFTPPTPADLEAFAKEEKLPLDIPKFHNHFTAKGWISGRTQIKDWRAAARNAARGWAKIESGKEVPTWM